MPQEPRAPEEPRLPAEPRVLDAVRARPGDHLALWALPALALSGLTLLAGGPAAPGAPAPLEAVGELARLAAALLAGLFVVVWVAAPAALLAEGKPLGEAAGVLARGPVLGVALAVAFFQTLALMLTLLPGLLAAYVNPLMAQLFQAVGVVGGAALAVGLYGRWMHAPHHAALGLGTAEALDASRADARAQGSFGYAMGLALLFGLAAFAGSALGLLAARAGLEGPMAQALARALPLWLGLAASASAPAARRLHWLRAGAPARGPPGLALRRRPTRCPRCGAVAEAPAGGGAVRCPSCGLQGLLRAR